MSNIRSAQAILSEIRDGDVLREMTDAIHTAVEASRQFQKPARIRLDITIAPAKVTDARMIGMPVIITAEIDTKLPCAEPPATFFFVDETGSPTRQLQQPVQAPLDIAPAAPAKTEGAA